MQISKLLIAFLIGGIWAATQQYEPKYELQPTSSVEEGSQICGVTNLPLHSFSEEAEKGKKLFRNNCASCHNKNMKDEMTGPALAGVEERWSNYPREDLFAFIRSSQKMITDGHPRATQIWDEFKPTIMNSFNLKDEEIDFILTYISEVSD